MVSAANVNTRKFNQSVEISVFAGSADLGSQNVFFFFFFVEGGQVFVQDVIFCVSPFTLPSPFFGSLSHHLVKHKYLQ